MKKSLVFLLTGLLVLSLAGTAFAGPFADVPAKHWAYDALNQLAKAGIIKGYDDGTYRGDNVISRYEMAIIVGKAMERSDKADEKNKALINKLSTEFAQELSNMGVRVATLETQVKNLSDKADKFQVSGSIRLRGTGADDEIYGEPNNANFSSHDVHKSYWQFRALVDIKSKIKDDVTAFVGLSSRNTMGSNPQAITNSNKENAFTRYGVNIKNGTSNYSIGRQGVTLGQGMVISTGFDAAGVDNKFDGLVADFAVGEFKLRAIGGKTTQVTTQGAPKWPDTPSKITEWYGLGVTSAPAKLTVGLVYAHASNTYAAGNNKNYFGVNASYNLTNSFTLKGEAVRSTAPTQNNAYTFAGVYKAGKDTYTARYISVQKYAVDPSNSGYGAWYYPAVGNNMGDAYEGKVLSYMHPIDSATTFSLAYAYYTVPGWAGANKELTGTVQWNF